MLFFFHRSRWHFAILHFVWANCKSYRELRFSPGQIYMLSLPSTNIAKYMCRRVTKKAFKIKSQLLAWICRLFLCEGLFFPGCKNESLFFHSLRFACMTRDQNLSESSFGVYVKWQTSGSRWKFSNWKMSRQTLYQIIVTNWPGMKLLTLVGI